MRSSSIVLAVSLLFSVSAQCADTLNIVLTGDILLDRGVRQTIERHGVDHLFSDGIDSVFQSAQVVVGNLECPATKIKSPVFKRFIFRGEPEWLDSLRQHGITHLNLANNHSIDDQPRKVWLVPSLRLALENYAYLTDKPCVSQESMDSLLSRVYHLRQQDSTAVIIVSLHWGQEHKLQPVLRQRHDAHMLVLAGADVLVCHHTHTLQTIEEYGGHKIYYSVGNFIFDQHKPLNSEACMVRLKVSQDSLEVETIPVEIRHCVPYLKVKK